jgi:ABC-type sugar transport system permease subunit
VYQQAFIYSDMGYASALSIILLAILFVVSAIQLRVLRARD